MAPNAPFRPSASPDPAPEPRAVVFCIVVAIAVAVLGLIGHVRGSGRSHDVALRWQPQIAPAAARVLLERLPVVTLAPEVAYDRVADFGPAWSDVDHNGCDTRNDILRRDLTDRRVRTGTNGCVILAGTMVDPYTGATIRFSKQHASDVQIDHLVPLHAAWMLGAYRWSPAMRLAYANDPRVLVAVDGEANQRKGDLLSDRWRPAFRGGWCVYAVNTVVIHDAYDLPLTRGERAALRAMLRRCR